MIKNEEFYLITNEKEEVVQQHSKIKANLEEFINILFEQIEEIVIFFDKAIPSIIVNIIFYIFKNLIKPNLLGGRDNVIRFLKNANAIFDKLDQHFLDSEVCDGYLNLMESIFYLILYNNDRSIILNLKGGDQAKYSFEANPDINLISGAFIKRFIYMYQFYYRSLEKVEMINFIIRKSLDILIGKNEFVERNILNMRSITPEQFNILAGKESQFIHAIKNNLVSNNETGDKLFEKLQRISRSLFLVNKKYFSYDYEFREYVVEINSILQDIRKNLINTEFECIPPLNKKYLSITPYDMGDKRNINKIKRIREIIKFTTFFRGLDGFLSIYSVEKKHYTNIPGLSENLTALLYFLYLLIKDDYQNILLLFSIVKPKNFVVCFADCDPYFSYFLEGIMDALFGQLHLPKIQYKNYDFDNYNFYCSLVLELIKLINLDVQDEMQFLKMIQILSIVLKLSRKPIKFASWKENSILTLIELVQCKLRKFKSNTKLKEYIDNYFLFKENLSREERIQNDILFVMLKNYLMFLNEIIVSDFYFMCYVMEWDFFIPLEDLEHLQAKEGIPIILKLEMLELINNIKLNFKVRCHDFFSSSRFMRLHNKNDNFLESNLKIPNLCGRLNNAVANPELAFLDTLNKHTNEYLEHTVDKLKEIFDKANVIKPIIRRKISLVKFFEKAIVNPAFNIINTYLQYGEFLEGRHLYSIYNIVFSFLKASYIFYDKIKITDIINDNIEDIKLLEKISVDQIEKFPLKIKLITKNFLKKLLKI